MTRTIVNAMHVPIDGEAEEIIAALAQRRLSAAGGLPGAERRTDQIRAVMKALGLGPDASDEEVRAAFAALFGDGKNDPAPAPAPEELTASQHALCVENKIDPAAFLAAKTGRLR